MTLLPVWRRRDNALGTLGNDYETAFKLAIIMDTTDIPNMVYSALWKVSQRTGLRIFRVDDAKGIRFKITRR